MSYRPTGSSVGYGEPTPSAAPESFSLIDRHSSVEGTFTSNRDLRVEGQVRGALRCQGLLYLAETADVDADVEAGNITVAGHLRGNVTCRGKFQIMPTGRVTATVTTESLVINEGAFFEGDLRMEGVTATASGATSGLEGDAAAALLRRFGSNEGEPSPGPAGQGQSRSSER